MMRLLALFIIKGSVSICFVLKYIKVELNELLLQNRNGKAIIIQDYIFFLICKKNEWYRSRSFC